MRSNFKSQGPRTKFQEPPRTKFQVPRTKFQELSSNVTRARLWSLVLGIWFFVVLVVLGLSSQRALAADRPANIQRAIDRGVAYLKSIQSTQDGMWHYIPPGGISVEQNIGATALAGLTLLECDVPPSDPAVQ